MNTKTTAATAEAEIHELVDTWLKAAKTKDIDGIMSFYAPDVLAFDAISQLQFKGAEAYRTHWEACLSMCSTGEMIFEVHDLKIVAGDEVAFSHCLNWCGGKDENGQEKAGWMRMTACYRKTSGKWKIVHEHFSVPFDMESGQALFDLKP